jgi:hypothetical protein
MVSSGTHSAPNHRREKHRAASRRDHAGAAEARAAFAAVAPADGTGGIESCEAKIALPQDPELICEKEEMLAGLRAARERTLAFIEETRGRDLSVYCYRHPFLGTLNLYEWFEMIASHEIRHTKQMREIAARLPKVVASLQK